MLKMATTLGHDYEIDKKKKNQKNLLSETS